MFCRDPDVLFVGDLARPVLSDAFYRLHAPISQLRMIPRMEKMFKIKQKKKASEDALNQPAWPRVIENQKLQNVCKEINNFYSFTQIFLI